MTDMQTQWQQCLTRLASDTWTAIDVLHLWSICQKAYDQDPTSYLSQWQPKLHPFKDRLSHVAQAIPSIELEQAAQVWPWAQFCVHHRGEQAALFEWLEQDTVKQVHILSVTDQHAHADMWRDPADDQWKTYIAHVAALAECPHLSNIQSLKLEACDLETHDLETMMTSPLFDGLKTLNLVHNYIEQDVLQCLEPVAHTIESLDLSYNHMQHHGDQAKTARWPKLRHLHLSSNKLTDEDFDALLEILETSELQTLILESNQLTDRSIERLAQHPCAQTLQTLSIADNPCTNAAMEILASTRWPALRHLNVHATAINGQGIERLMRAPCFRHLQSLRADLNDISAACAHALLEQQTLSRADHGKLQNHQYYKLNQSTPDVEPNTVMAELRSLMHRDDWHVIDAHQMGFGHLIPNRVQMEHVLSLLSAAPNEHTIRYVHDFIDVKALPKKRITQIEDLVAQIERVPLPIYDVHAGEASYDVSPRIMLAMLHQMPEVLPYIHTLTVAVDDADAMIHLLKSEALHQLRGLHCEYTDQIECWAELLHHLCHPQQLRALDITACEHTLEPLTRLPLERLQQLSMRLFDDDAEDHEAFFEHLRCQSLRTLEIVESDVMHMGRILPQRLVQTLHQLNLYENDLRDDELIDLCQKLQHNKILQALDLSSNGFSSVACQTMATHLAHLPLKSLDLAYTPIGDEGLIALARGTLLSNIEYLDLSGCNLTDDGLEHFIHALDAPHLRVLNLNNNQLTQESFLTIARAPTMRALEYLDVDDNKDALPSEAYTWIAHSPYLKRLESLTWRDDTMVHTSFDHLHLRRALNPYLFGEFFY